VKIITCIRNKRGATLLELLVVIVILSFIVVGLSELLSGGLKASRDNRVKSSLIDDANFAMGRILFATRETNWVFIPGNANPVRDVLAVSAMSDNDGDGALDEDWGEDIGNDNQPGLAGFDDDGDGSIDEGGVGRKNDDDEDDRINEDTPGNGLDDDVGPGGPDGNYDEEFRADINGDGCPGICTRDDDWDGLYDEGNINDDDEDGMVDEDPIDPLIFYVTNGALYEKKIIWNPSTSLSEVAEKKLIDNVSQFAVTRLLGANGKTLINVVLEVSAGGGGNSVRLETEIYPRLHPDWVMP